MKEIIYDKNGKRKTFLNYFIIKDGFLYSTTNFNIEDTFENCLYIRKLGSNVNPKIYYSEKKNNEWIKNNILIGDYYSLMDFIADNESSIICIRGFSKAIMANFTSALNKLKDMNIQPYKLLNKVNKNESYCTDLNNEKYKVRKKN